jgi:mRNA-degrading endonuclease toxin of MazEF toxin-antitoxin module
MDPQQGDIYWVDIPAHHTQGSEQYGRKPFIVMSRNAVNKRLKTVIVVPMTTFQGQTADLTVLAGQPPFRIVIPVAEITKDPSCTSALSVSVAKTDQARVIDKTRLQQKIGRLSQTAIISVGVGLAYVFDIR